MTYGRMNRTGRAGGAFTLIELLVVVAIIGLLIGLLIPAIGGARASARKTTTVALMTSVNQSINQFRSDKGRLPGYFSQNDLSNTNNTTGLTAMQNALLELAGGPNADAPLSLPNVININIGSGNQVRVDMSAIGATDGPGYLNVPIKAKPGETGGRLGLGTAEFRDKARSPALSKTADGSTYVMPEILDAWGRPLVLWMKNESAGTRPEFARENSNSTTNRALFYWWSNAGIFGLLAGASPSESVHRTASLLGGNNDGGVSTQERLATMRAILGHPAYPDPDPDLPAPYDAANAAPASPLADFVMHSAGPDEVFLSRQGRRGDSRITSVLYPAYYEQVIKQNPGSASATFGDRRPLSDFDDLIQPGN